MIMTITQLKSQKNTKSVLDKHLIWVEKYQARKVYSHRPLRHCHHYHYHHHRRHRHRHRHRQSRERER